MSDASNAGQKRDLQQKIDELKGTQWDSLQGNELAVKDQLGTETINMVRTAVSDAVSLCEPCVTEFFRPEIAPHVETTLRMAKQLVATIQDYNRRTAEQPAAGASAENTRKQFQPMYRQLFDNALPLRVETLMRTALTARGIELKYENWFTQTAFQQKTDIETFENGLRLDFEKLKTETSDGLRPMFERTAGVEKIHQSALCRKEDDFAARTSANSCSEKRSQ